MEPDRDRPCQYYEDMSLTKMLQCQGDWIAWNFWISERKVLADTEETLEVNVGLHADDDGRPCCLHVLLSVSADEDEGVGHGA